MPQQSNQSNAIITHQFSQSDQLRAQQVAAIENLKASLKQNTSAENFELSQISDQEAEAILANVKIEGDEFSGKKLTADILKKEGLFPRHKIKVGDAVIWFSSSVYDAGEGRMAVVAYVEKNKETFARTYYRSNSQGLWRYLPDYRLDAKGEIDHYGKGAHEDSITLPIALQKALSEISKDGMPVMSVSDPNLVMVGTARKYSKTRPSGSGQLESTPHDLEKKFYKQKLTGKHAPPEEVMLAPEQSPDFSKLVTTWEQTSTLYGKVKVEVFPSNDGKLKFMFCQDSRDRAWIGGIEDDSEVQSTGLKKSWIYGGELTTPAYEYKDQAGAYGNTAMRKKGYVDMFNNYLSEIPVIKEYLDQRSAKTQSKTKPKSARTVASASKPAPASTASTIPGSNIPNQPPAAGPQKPDDSFDKDLEDFESLAKTKSHRNAEIDSIKEEMEAQAIQENQNITADLPPMPRGPLNPEEEPASEQKETALDKIKKAVEEKREKYAKCDYETTSILSRIKMSIPFINFQSKNVDKVNSSFNQYQISLRELLDHEINAIKEKNLPEKEFKKELGILIKYFNYDEKIKLFETRTEARAKAREGKWGEWLMKRSSQVTDWYRKLNWKYKLAFSGVLLAGGLTGVAGVGLLAMANRAVSGAAAGGGVTAGLEAMYRKKETKKAEKEMQEKLDTVFYAPDQTDPGSRDIINMKEVTDLNARAESIQSFLEAKIADYDKDLKQELKKSGQRIFGGAAIGVVLGSGAMKHVIDGGLGGFKDGWSAAKSYFGDWFSGSEIPKGNVVAPELHSPDVIEHHESVPGQISTHLTIEKGSSITDTLQKNNISSDEAYRMVLRFAREKGIEPESFDLVFPDQEINLSPDGKEIIGLTETVDSKFFGSIKDISLGDKNAWHIIKEMSMNEAMSDLDDKYVQSLTSKMVEYKNAIGNAANPKDSETVQKWLVRMTRLTMKK